jgi:hypothetical protein
VAKGSSDSSIGETGQTQLPHKHDDETHQEIRAMEIDKELEAAAATYIKQSDQAESHMENMELEDYPPLPNLSLGKPPLKMTASEQGNTTDNHLHNFKSVHREKEIVGIPFQAWKC